MSVRQTIAPGTGFRLVWETSPDQEIIPVCKTRRSLLRLTLPVLLLCGSLLVMAPAIRAEPQATSSEQTSQQIERTAHEQHMLMLFPAGVVVLTLILILWTRRK